MFCGVNSVNQFSVILVKCRVVFFVIVYVQFNNIVRPIKHIETMGRVCAICDRAYFKDCGVSFHRFPTNQDKRSLWCQRLTLDSTEYEKKFVYLCSQHFDEDSFYISPSGIRYIKEDALPSLTRRSRSIEEIQSTANAHNQPKNQQHSPNVTSNELVSHRSSTNDVHLPPCPIRAENQQQISNKSGEKVTIQNVPISSDDRLTRKAVGVKRHSIEDIQFTANAHNRPKNQQSPNVSSNELVSCRSSTNDVHLPPCPIRSENQQQISNKSGEKLNIQNVPVSSDDRLTRSAHGVKRVRFDIPTDNENVSSSKQQITTTSNQSHVSASTTETNSVKVIPVTPDQIQNLSNTPGIKLIPVTPNQVQNMSSPGVLIAVPTGSSESAIQLLTPNSSAVINKVVISPLQRQTIGVQNVGSLSPDALPSRVTSGQTPNSSKFQYILPKPPSVTAGVLNPPELEIDIKEEEPDSVESLEVKSELDSELELDADKGTDSSGTLTASDTSETLSASETEEICTAMDKRALRYDDVERPKEIETRNSDTNSIAKCKMVRYFGDITLDDLRTNYTRASHSWNIIQKTVKKDRGYIDQMSEENKELTQQINKIKNALRLLKEEGYVTSMSPSWEAEVEEPKIIEPSPSGSSNSVAKKLSFWRIEKQD
ncbi:unnamed protein product [Callosobruchus maculatus]|uniref:THAP-type domain-containing protein n=1 Tax=Callosobruchus maculatus TaxID=64391 RepID=A0A653DR71_CALMS|nr:unnamed protein product [Callosobruchus maculatus]